MLEFDTTKMVEEITMQVEESQEEFIFKTILPYCENILQMSINKEELKQILLNGKRNLQSGVTVTDFADRCKECEAEYEKLLEASKPKAGHWISSSNGWMCSNCREDASHETNFCPHCGTDMRESEEV